MLPLLPCKFHTMLYIDSDLKECLDRRQSRTYEFPEPPWYNEQIVLPAALRVREEVIAKSWALVRGSLLEDILGQIEKHIRMLTNL
jgi:hypothetical protein